MSNSFYNHSTYPAPNSAGSSAALRAELDLVTAGFNKMPTLSGNGYKLVGVNAAGDALEAGAALSGVDFSTSNTMANAVARLNWNDTDGTLDLGLKGGNVVLQIGQEQVVRVYNGTATAFSVMQVVRVTGSSGTRLTAGLAQANTENSSSSTLAITTESTAPSAEGFATTFGLIRSINTSAFAEGATLYLSPSTAGGVTTTKPTAPNQTVILGWCVRSHATLGQIYVNIDNGSRLDKLNDVNITTVAAYNMLRRNAANTVWENVAGPSGSVVGTTDTQTLTNKTFSGGTINAASITGLSNPTNSGDAANKSYVDSLVQGLDAKASVRATTTANITLSGAQTIDGIAVVAGDRVLVKDQTTTANNGIYVVATGSWTRATDADTWDELVSAYVFVEGGTTNADNGFTCTISSGGTLGTTAITWVQFSGAGQITAGNGLTKTGNTINVVTASSTRIVVGTDSIDLATTGVTAGNYGLVTVDVYGRVTTGSLPTTLAGFGITNAYTKTEVDTLFGTYTSSAASAAAALVSENAAAASASAASTSEGNALTSKNAAATSASAAATSATSAASSATSAAASYDSFDDRYLGPKSTNPAVDNDGNALLTGALYWNTAVPEMRVYTGSAWVSASTVGGTVTTLSVTGNTTLGGAVGDTITVNGTTTFVSGLANSIGYLNSSKVFTTIAGFTFDGTKLLVNATTNTNTSTVVSGGTISETVGSTQYLVASQYDVGTAPNQIPLNQYLGTMAYQDSAFINVGNLYSSGTGGNYFAGNVGVGVTPSAWAAGNFNALQIGAGASLVGRATGQASPLDELYVSANAYNDGAWKYIGTAAATQYYQDAGTHVWRTAASGTAGTAISFTQAMTLDASSNLQVQAGAIVPWAPAPAAISAAATLSNANIQGQVINTTGTTYTVTMPLGTTMETLVPWAAVNLGYDFYVVNTASGIITMAVNTGVTAVGSLTVATGASAHFRIRRTAANTFIMYRLS